MNKQTEVMLYEQKGVLHYTKKTEECIEINNAKLIP